MKRQALVTMMLLILTTAFTAAQEGETETGQVQLPLDTYDQLVDASRTPVKVPRPVPAAYAVGTATVNVTVTSTGTQASAEVSVQVGIRVFEDEWSSVPVLPSGTPVESAAVNGQQVQLVPSPYGLIWGVDKAGSYTMTLRYRVDATSSEAGFALPLPVPQAAATTLTATIPGTGLDVTVIPSAGMRSTTSGGNTRITATCPTTSGVQLSWRVPTTRGHALSRGRYTGSLAGDAVTWTGALAVEVFNDDTVTLPLLPRTVTLQDVQVDGTESPILVEGNSFATLVRGRGRHTVTIGFQVPVIRGSGPPRIDLVIPQVPVSRFDLTLPGKKEVTATPKASVTSRTSGDNTVATVFVQMGSSVSFSWAEAVPEAVRAEVRANAALYHTVHAEEGVLYVRAMVVYEVTRGETNLIRLEVPPGVQVNRIDSPSGAVADWRITGSGGDGREVSVFLDRMVQGELMLDVLYDRSLGDQPLVVPLLRSTEAQRQRGMVALLSSKELTLRPIDEGGATRVGENQLPAFVRDAVTMTVAHTFKYVEVPRQLTVEAVPPERKQGRFDAQVDTLISLDEVSMHGSASIEINVKSGGIMDLQLRLPERVSLLSLTGPSLRTHEVTPEEGQQRIDVHFTQEMEGQFRLEVGYERIHDPDAGAGGEAEVPTVAVDGAEVVQGQLAVEARSAVEVQPEIREGLTQLDINELPQQLVLRTTNPILLAYKYVQTDPPHRLVLKITRHREVSVQEAAIDTANYRTLFTPDGLAVTIAEFLVKNSRKQFLRLRLPEESEVWSAFVDGKAEKPAMGEGDAAGTVLIKIVTSTRGFPVQLIYATKGSGIGWLGTLHATLPRPDILVTHSRWDVFLPDDMSYGDVSSNMIVEVEGERTKMRSPAAEVARLQEGAAVQAVAPLRIEVPATGWHYAFSKLYANQGKEEAWFKIPYASSTGAWIGRLVTLLLTALVWLGAGLAWLRRGTMRTQAAAGAAISLLLLVILCYVWDDSLTWALSLSVAIILAVAGRFGWSWYQRRQAAAAAAQGVEPVEPEPVEPIPVEQVEPVEPIPAEPEPEEPEGETGDAEPTEATQVTGDTEDTGEESEDRFIDADDEVDGEQRDEQE